MRLRRLLYIVFFVLFLFGGVEEAHSQRVALRTNVVDWATLSPNLTLETRLNKRLSLGMGFVGNPFKVDVFDTRFQNLRFQPELRYWFNRPMARHFAGVAGLAGVYNWHHKEDIRKGDIFGLGLTYGYAVVLGKRWNVEFTAGIGFARTRYFSFEKGAEQPDSPNEKRWIFVPMNVGVSFSYIIN